MYPDDTLRIKKGLDTLLTHDKHLLVHNVSERAITHKLAEHYQVFFHEWNVDCEYNRNLDGPKEIFINPKEILQKMANKLEDKGYLLDIKHAADFDADSIKKQMHDLEKQLRDPDRLEYLEELGIALFTLTLVNGEKIKKTIFPDIIIHRRGTQNNHIVIEAKKSINTDIKARAYDLIKLITLVSSPNFNYKRGYFIDIPVGADFAGFSKFLKPNLFEKDIYKIEPEYNNIHSFEKTKFL